MRVDGKFFRDGDGRWYLKGLTYGPFAPAGEGSFLPDPARRAADFARLRSLGANAIRVYHVPERHVLDEAGEAGLRVFVDVPWQKHRCMFEDGEAVADARRRVGDAARLLGGHPALFAISVVNEIPADIARFYGARRVERLIDDLLDLAKQAAPDALVTFANYPSTEFLQPSHADFACFNVYLHDTDALAAYLRRLQHHAGAAPLVLGEYGVDSFRHGEEAQARQLAGQTSTAFDAGLAGAVAFSFTDDWFTGGHAVGGWAFGVTDRGRAPKPAAAALAAAWQDVPTTGRDAPAVSVVVCSYNGATTLAECLASLTRVRYPSFEIVLVDDGSTDATPAIAARFPTVRMIRQPNLGLSVARNVGAAAATGDIIVYTDSDCVAEPNWLTYLVAEMRRQGVAAIGGPNLSPPSDSRTAKCVAASPGAPTHVMLDDQRAEHLPGCNLAVRRDVLNAIGGFDPQFRQAGDDVDLCWRLLAAGHAIGYAPGAFVWHHRRHTVQAYLRQQRGYGRAEAMLQFKYPAKFAATGGARWHGMIYAERAVVRHTSAESTFHGRFGAAPFQLIYRRPSYGPWGYAVLFEWHLLALFACTLALAWSPIAVVPAAMWTLTLAAAARAAALAPPVRPTMRRYRPLVALLNLVQPVVRGWHRHAYRVAHRRLPPLPARTAARGDARKLHFTSRSGVGREQLLDRLVAEAHRMGFAGETHSEWSDWDLTLGGDLCHDVRVHTASEALGQRSRFTRARITLRPTPALCLAIAACVAWTVAAVATGHRLGMLASAVASACVAGAALRSRRRCLRAGSLLISTAAAHAGLHADAGAPASEARSGAATAAAISDEAVAS